MKGKLYLYILHLDHFGPLEKTDDDYKYILVVVDAYTKFVWLHPISTTGSKKVIEFFDTLFNLFGSPRKLISDRGTTFSFYSFKQYVQTYDIAHMMVAIASPWANGAVERVNRFLKSILAKTIVKASD